MLAYESTIVEASRPCTPSPAYTRDRGRGFLRSANVYLIGKCEVPRFPSDYRYTV